MTKKIVNVNGHEIEFDEFDLNKMKPDPTIAMIAKRGSGKSYVCRDLLRKLKETVPGGAIISQTEKVNPFFSDVFPTTFIHDECDPVILEKILQRQEEMKLKNEKKEREGKKINYKALLLMDDCMSDKNIWKEKCMRDIFFNGRHFGLTFIFTMQYPVGVSPDFRGNIDYVFLLNEDIQQNLKRIYDMYAGIFPTFAGFKQVFSQLTTNYGCMVIDNRAQGKEITDKVFWYKAKTASDFEFGGSQFKKFHDKSFDPTWKEKGKRELKASDILKSIKR